MSQDDPPFNGHGPEGTTDETDQDTLATYRSLVPEQGDTLFHSLMRRMGHSRATVAGLWLRIIKTRFGMAELPPPRQAAEIEFVSNDSRANREPIGKLIVRWRRLPTAEHLIDLEVSNVPPDE